ncbi:hypothetical protein NE619_13150 [Anaerovorax odorimutans]|uniref:HK97 gp10 family phage protein n=1 Tax=Anaerovorax odorimutans TaxID=109327 RepID=A0ABT1RR98_9FIRM|nr:hypothetical protein [Anaerovorax odorimutans]MCQ4637674.1 hypothetical protein [Anaerovorax odorimutans]
MTISLKVSGIDELQHDFEQAVQLYPELAQKRLRRHKFRLKNYVKKLVCEKVKTDRGLTKGFSASDKGDINELRVEFSAEGKKNPHFHLIEEGHDIVMPFTRNGTVRKDGGQVKGYVPGIKAIPQASKNYEEIFETDIRDMADELLKKAGLI